MDLVDYARSMDPLEQQMMLANVMKNKKRGDDVEALAAANQRAHSLDTLAAVSQMANNPGAAQAAKVAQAGMQAQKPQQMGTQGFMLPGSGQFVASPMFQDEHAAQRDAIRANKEAAIAAAESNQRQNRDLRASLEAASEAGKNERASADRILRQTLGEERNRIAAERADRAKEKEQEAASKVIQTGVQKLSAFADKKQMPRLISQGRQLLSELDQADLEGRDVPGLSTMEQGASRIPGADRLLSPKAIDNMGAYQGILNALTRADAGLSQTQGEVLRQQLETFNHPLTSAKTRATILRTHILPLLETARSATLGSAPKEVRDAYRQYQTEIGGDPSWMDPLVTATEDPDDALINKYLPKPGKK